LSASRETISHPVVKIKKRMCLQCKSYQQNQQIVLRISFSNSTFLSKGTKKDMLFVLDIMQVTFVTKPIVDLPWPTTDFNSMLSNENCNDSDVTT